jgi:transcriptional regulator with XRE-family HTH domain
MADAEWKKKFGNLLEGYIHRSGLQMQTISAFTGISERALRSYICGDRLPDIETLAKLGHILSIPMDQFFYILRTNK